MENRINVLAAIASFKEAAEWLSRMPDVIADGHENLYVDATETIAGAADEVEGLSEIVTEFNEAQEEALEADPDLHYLGPGDAEYWDAILKIVNSK